MDLSKAKGETWSPICNGEERSLPLFKNEEEMKKAEQIVHVLEGMSISSAKELINKVSSAIEQITII